ncbi:MAG: alpha/beta hydrolase [Anaerolineae bacterium]
MSQPSIRPVTVSRLRLNVCEWGTPGQPLLVLLHGLASTLHMFDLIAPQLASDFHVIAYDQRGHGLSDKPVTGYDFETVAADLDHLLDALGLTGQPFVLAGHSWGAYTALYYAATRSASVHKTILIDGGLRPMTDYFSRVEEMAPPQHHNWALEEVKRMIREDWLGAAFRPELEQLVLSIYDTSNPSAVKPHLSLKNHMEIASALWNFRAVDYYTRIQSPLLVINAVNTGNTPDPRLQAYVAAVEQQVEHCKAIWMPDTIHDIPWQRPGQLVEIMRAFMTQDLTP